MRVYVILIVAFLKNPCWKFNRFCRAVESAIRHGIDLNVLGWGIPWRGLSQKLEAAMTFAQSVPKEDVIMFTDAFDVMFMKKPEYILHEFLSYEGQPRILFAGEVFL
jgi:hypothetical protein